MENSNFKNSLIAAGVAVFAGVITLGANVALGVTAPSQNPADAALYSPVFNGVDVQGKIKNSDPAACCGGAVLVDDSLQAQGPITAISGLLVDPNLGIKTLGNLGIVIIYDNLFVAGHNAGAGGFGVHIDGNKGSVSTDSGYLVLNSKLDAQKEIVNTSGLNDGKVTVDDDIKIHGQISNTSTKVSGGVTVENPVTINDKEGLLVNFGKLDTWGPILNTVGNPVEITGDLNVNYSDIKGVLTGAPLGSGKIRSNSLDTQSLTNSVYTTSGGVQNNLPVNIEDDLKVTGEVKAGTWVKTKDFQSTGALWSNGSAYFKELDIEDDLRVTGEVKAGTWVKTKDFQSTGALWSDGDAYFKTLDVFNEGVGDVTISNGEIKASHDLSLGNYANDQRFLFHSRNNGGGDFLQITNDRADGSWDWNNGLRIYRGTTEGVPSTKLQVSGKITSTGGFGTTNQYSSSTVLSPGVGGSVSVSCPASEKLLSCAGKFNQWGFLNSIIPDYTNSNCTAWGKNPDVGDTMTVYALCLNPAQ